VENPGLAGGITQGAVTEGASNGKTSSLSTSTVLRTNPTPVPGSVTTPTPAPAVAKLVDLAKQNLAGRLKIALDQITLLNATEITAADLYAGCTRKAGQVVMPNESGNGYQISLEAQGQDYLYHAGMNDQVVLCEPMNPGTSKP
jgi:hypothetical protein